MIGRTLLCCLAWAISPALAPLPPAADPHCLWMAREQIPFGTQGPADCLSKCHQLCVDHPREYLCSGFLAHSDSDEYQYDDTSSQKYSYCICQRSIVTRQPGVNCGPGVSCPSGAQFVDGVNTFVPEETGELQGLAAKTIEARIADQDWDDDVDGPCDPTLFQQLRYMFDH